MKITVNQSASENKGKAIARSQPLDSSILLVVPGIKPQRMNSVAIP
jgi:hypothetical protein